MASLTNKRLIAGVGGSLYAVVYGFWTMISTGGGHVNFIWFELFLTVGLIGLYFPLMAVMAVDLRSRVIKLIFGSLIGFHLVVSIIMIVGWVMEPDRPSDYTRAIRANGAGVILLAGVIHFLPTLVFLFFFIESILFRSSVSDEESTILDLS